MSGRWGGKDRKKKRLLRNKLFDKCKGKCPVCNCSMVKTQIGDTHSKHLATLDHIIPLREGGTNENKNLRIMCRQCNMKRDKENEPRAT